MSTHDAVKAILEDLAQARVPDDPDSSLFDAGVLDSFGVMDLVNRLEAEFGIKIPDEAMVPDRFETLTKIVRQVDQRKRA